MSARFFLNANQESGIDYMLRATNTEEKIIQSDLVITGEGKFDQQSLRGKVVSGIAALCRKHGKVLWVVCGKSDVESEAVVKLGIEKVISLAESSSDISDLMKRAAFHLDVAMAKAIR